MAEGLFCARRSLGCFRGCSQRRYTVLFARKFFHLLHNDVAQARVARAWPAAPDEERGQLDACRRAQRSS